MTSFDINIQSDEQAELYFMEQEYRDQIAAAEAADAAEFAAACEQDILNGLIDDAAEWEEICQNYGLDVETGQPY